MPRFTYTSVEYSSLPSGLRSGVSVRRTSFTGAKELTTRERGATCFFCSPRESVHVVCMEQESLPTGIETPSFGQKLRPTSFTVS